MRSSSSALRLLLRILFLGVLILSVPVTALAVLYAEPFEAARRANVEHLISEAIDTEVEVRGPISIGFGWTPTISIEDLVAVEGELPPDLKGLSAKSVKLELPIMPLLAGDVQLNALVIDRLAASVEIPEGGAAADDGGVDVTELIGDFVRSRFAGDLLLREPKFDYVNHDSGFQLHYLFDEIATRPSGDGGVVINGTGELNGEPWKLDGDVEPPGEDDDTRKFALALNHVGLRLALAGTYEFDAGLFDFDGDTVDMTVTASAPHLKRFLTIYGISGDLEGTADLTGRLTGSLDALKLSGLAAKLAFDTGDTYQLAGDVADIAEGTGLALELNGAFAREPLAEGAVRPIYDLGITGFNGRVEGSFDGLLVRDFHVFTSSISSTLRDIGPITAERLYKNKDGQLGLYDVLVLAGDPKRPSVRVAGTVKDIISFKGVDLKGEIDFLTADILDLAAEEHAEDLGHLSGHVAISDADGSFGIEQLSAKVTDSSLIKLAVDLVFDDIPEAKELKFATHLDIPKFKPFAAALGSDVEEVGQVKFDGSIAGSDEKIVMAGTLLAGATTIKGSLAGALSEERKPVLTGDISTPLLHLSDLTTLASINVVYRENVDEQDEDVFDYSKVWETLFVDLAVQVAAIAGGGTDASNIEGRVTYLAGVIGLAPLSLTYLGGKASANGKIDTTGQQNTFALKGSVSNLRIGKVLKEMKVSYPVSGALNVTYDLSGAGNTKAQIPRSLNGSLSASLRNGWIGTGLLDLAGMSLPAWLLTRSPGGNQATLVCSVAPFSFKNGRGSTRGLVLETRNVQVVGAGSIDFRGDRIDLHFKPEALQKQFIKIAQPFAIQGKLGNPSVKLTGAPVAGAVVGTLASPLNLLATIVQPKAGTPGRVPCRVAQAAPQGGRATTTTKPRSGGPLGLGILGGGKKR
jgi:AsmA family protein